MSGLKTFGSGRAREALSRLNAMAASVLRISNYALTINVLAAYAHVFARLGDDERAARLLGANWAHATKGGVTVEPEQDELWLQHTGVVMARDNLGQQRWEHQLHVGGAYSLEEALADAQQADAPE